jgi:oligoribonuclease NrnB/cAMP/cGMP phosphodiesterase (DHH superfamily)
MNKNPIMCIYHKGCFDGFMSASIVHEYYRTHGSLIELVPGIYQEDIFLDVKGKLVVIVDFSYPLAKFKEILKDALFVIWIDHHKSAIDNLKPYIDSILNDPSHEYHKKISVLLDINHSGCRLTYNYFYKDEKTLTMPQIIDYIEDRDLWKFKLPYTKEIMQYVSLYDFTLEHYKEMASDFDLNIDKFIEGGKLILKKYNNDINRILHLPRRQIRLGGYKVDVINCNALFSSDIGNVLAKTNTFGVTYYDLDNKRNFSLRSIDDFDVSTIASIYGGGGHKNAAGFTVPFEISTNFE